MPGFEVFGKEEQEAINELFRLNGGILFAHAFDGLRKGVYRVREFEAAFARRLGVPYAQAVSSGTAALKVGLKAMGLKPGDEVITQSFTFVATVEAILDVGARPVIVDVDETLNMCPQSLEEAITPRTRAIIPVHMLGVPAAMDEIMAVARKQSLLVLEDNAQGVGGTYKGKNLGTIGEVGAFSFDFGKAMVTGEGGMVVSHREDFYLRARAAHDHGHEYNKALPRGQEGALLTGFNYRMSELQGAIGLVQLQKLDMIIKRQRENKKALKERLQTLPVKFRELPDPAGDCGDTLVFFLNSREQAATFARKMGEAGLGTKNLPDAIRWHFARHWQHMFTEYGFYQDTFATEWQKSADLLERSIALPIMVKMTPEQIADQAEKLTRIAQDVL